MFYVLMNCNDPGVLRITLMVKDVIEIIKYVVPIILIVLCILESIKNVGSSSGFDPKIMKKIISKIIAAVMIFLVPTIVNIALSILGEERFELSKCWINATQEKIDSFKEDVEENENGEIVNRSNDILESLKLRKELFKSNN